MGTLKNDYKKKRSKSITLFPPFRTTYKDLTSSIGVSPEVFEHTPEPDDLKIESMILHKKPKKTLRLKQQFILLILLISASGYSQSRFSKSELSINGFRAPSIGAEFRYDHVSVHSGYYLTAFSGVTTNFLKAGLTAWFLPVGKKENPSSFYAGPSYMRGLNRDYKNKNSLGIEAGFRWMIWEGLNLRIGAIAVAANGESLKINPAGGISYSFFFNKN